MGMVWNVLSSFLCYIFLINYTDEGNDIKDINIFVVMILFSIIMYPLGILPDRISKLYFKI